MRLLTPLLCLLLAISAVGRFRAEATHRAVGAELSALEQEADRVELTEHQLRLEVEVLESSSRLSDVNGRTIALSPATSSQVTDRGDFAQRIGRASATGRVDLSSDVIGNAIIMADPATASEGGRR